MKATLALNHEEDIAFFYGEPLNIVPHWAAIDVELKELQLFDDDGTGQMLKLDKIDQSVYERICRKGKIFLVRVKDNDIAQPEEALWVDLMIAQQI